MCSNLALPRWHKERALDDQNKLVTTIKDLSERHWAEKKSPVLLSALPKLLEGEVPDYRSVLGSRTLKAFIKETEEATGYKLIEHPTQHMRVAVAPAAVDYQFPLDPSPLPKTIASKNSQDVTLAFFRALATLPDTDLDKVTIPVSVLVKLLK